MKASPLIGKKIVHIKQTKFFNPQTGTWNLDVEYIELDNGWKLVPVTIETDTRYAHTLIVRKTETTK